jgi:hypothetical protein
MRKTGEFENAKAPDNDGYFEYFEKAESEKVKARTRKCKMCEYLTEWNICEVCNCWMPVKIQYEGTLCPLAKWDETPNYDANAAKENPAIKLQSEQTIETIKALYESKQQSVEVQIKNDDVEVQRESLISEIFQERKKEEEKRVENAPTPKEE